MIGSATLIVGVAYTASDLAAIQAARLSGVREVHFAERSTTYKSDAEMRQVEIDIRTELAQTSGRTRQFVGVASKGLGCS